jgi:hypothetical protein
LCVIATVGGGNGPVDIFSAYRAAAPAMVDFQGIVTSVPTYFMGSRTHCRHEEFSVRSAAGPLEVVDNVDIAPQIPLSPGDSIEVRGEMVHDPGKPPVVHWTHHDPGGRHPGGFIRYRGQMYA